MRGKGINYDTGAHPAGGCTRTSLDSATVRREIQIIADDLHCTAVRICGGDPDRLSIAAEQRPSRPDHRTTSLPDRHSRRPGPSP